MPPKYRQRGYQENGPEPASKPEQKPRDRDHFRGRSEGRYKEEVFRCQECNDKIYLTGPVAVADTCPKCKADLRSCKNCKFFNPVARHECQREEITERISKKSKANECTFFSPRIVLDLISAKAVPATPEDARRAFENLFKKP